MKKTLIFSLILLAAAGIWRHVSAADDSKAFCDAMTGILDQAGKDFSDMTGEAVPDDKYKVWKAKTNLPGTVKSGIVDEMVISKYYYAEFKGTADKAAIRAQFQQYAEYLKACMDPKGYQIQKMPNEQKLEGFEDIIYRMNEETSTPIENQPFVQMTVKFDDASKMYFIRININQSFL